MGSGCIPDPAGPGVGGDRAGVRRRAQHRVRLDVGIVPRVPFGTRGLFDRPRAGGRMDIHLGIGFGPSPRSPVAASTLTRQRPLGGLLSVCQPTQAREGERCAHNSHPCRGASRARKHPRTDLSAPLPGHGLDVGGLLLARPQLRGGDHALDRGGDGCFGATDHAGDPVGPCHAAAATGAQETPTEVQGGPPPPQRRHAGAVPGTWRQPSGWLPAPAAANSGAGRALRRDPGPDAHGRPRPGRSSAVHQSFRAARQEPARSSGPDARLGDQPRLQPAQCARGVVRRTFPTRRWS